VDFSQVAIDKARRLAAQHGVRLDWVCADLASWDWGEPRFDVVVGIFFQFAAPHLRTKLFAEMQRVLLPGGVLLLEGYTPRQLQLGTGVHSRLRISTHRSCCVAPFRGWRSCT